MTRRSPLRRLRILRTSSCELCNARVRVRGDPWWCAGTCWLRAGSLGGGSMSFKARMLINGLASLGCVGFSFAHMVGPTWLMCGVIWLWAGYAIVLYRKSKREQAAEMLRLDVELGLLLNLIEDRSAAVYEAQVSVDEAEERLNEAREACDG